jgi:hypothetical protein
MDDDESLATARFDVLRPHQAAAVRVAIAGLDVDVLGPQTGRAVVSITPVGQRQHVAAAVFAYEAPVLGTPVDGSASRSKK